uniref:Uncharacterized protein n=1 Tax=Ditylenchus dipsaci TaxID=166011 RepID=A0A915E9C9_9BILA
MQTGSVGIVPATCFIHWNFRPLRIADLRNGIIKTHEFLSAGLETERAEHDLDQFKLRLEKFSKEIADGYDQLETKPSCYQLRHYILTNKST